MASTKFDDNSGTSGISAPGSFGVWGDSKAGYGVVGTSGGPAGVYGESNMRPPDELEVGGIGVEGKAIARGGTGVKGTGTTYGVRGIASLSIGTGVLGQGGYFGVYGTGGDLGVCAESRGAGVLAKNTFSGTSARLATPAWAGEFSGPVIVFGSIVKVGAAFMIDHPLDPENRYLHHSSVESTDRKNIYDGIAVLNGKGEAAVELPEWFSALNRDFRYQLTCLGRYEPVYVAQKIENNGFRIAGGSPGLKVSWQVTGIRQDPWANANPLTVETEKPEKERGTFLYPELYGQPEEKSLQRALYPQMSPPEPPPQLTE